jgi:hypothetical protein
VLAEEQIPIVARACSWGLIKKREKKGGGGGAGDSEKHGSLVCVGVCSCGEEIF